jgi:hypothetical protein
MVTFEKCGINYKFLWLFSKNAKRTNTHKIPICCDLKNVGRISLSGVQPKASLLDAFAREYPLAKELIDRSFLSESLKRSSWLSYDYRRQTLSFE